MSRGLFADIFACAFSVFRYFTNPTLKELFDAEIAHNIGLHLLS